MTIDLKGKKVMKWEDMERRAAIIGSLALVAVSIGLALWYFSFVFSSFSRLSSIL